MIASDQKLNETGKLINEFIQTANSEFAHFSDKLKKCYKRFLLSMDQLNLIDIPLPEHSYFKDENFTETYKDWLYHLSLKGKDFSSLQIKHDLQFLKKHSKDKTSEIEFAIELLSVAIRCGYDKLLPGLLAMVELPELEDHKKELLFKDSFYYENRQLFFAQLAIQPYLEEKIDFQAYFYRCENYSQSENYKSFDWLATAKIFIDNDIRNYKISPKQCRIEQYKDTSEQNKFLKKLAKELHHYILSQLTNGGEIESFMKANNIFPLHYKDFKLTLHFDDNKQFQEFETLYVVPYFTKFKQLISSNFKLEYSTAKE